MAWLREHWYASIITLTAMILAFIGATISVYQWSSVGNRALLEFLTGTWPGSVYNQDELTNQGFGYIWFGVFFRILIVFILPIILGLLTDLFQRRESMLLKMVIDQRDRLIQTRLRAELSRRFAEYLSQLDEAKLTEFGISADTIDELIDKSVPVGISDGAKEWENYLKRFNPKLAKIIEERLLEERAA